MTRTVPGAKVERADRRATLPQLLRGAPADLSRWLGEDRRVSVGFFLGLVFIGATSYGLVMGGWRGPLQAVYTGIKLPILILLTTTGNGLLNAILAPLLGLNFSPRKTWQAILITFSIAMSTLGALAPISAFVVWSLPSLGLVSATNHTTYAFLQLLHFGLIAVCGLIGNWVLWPTLRQQSGSARVASLVLASWLGANLLLGSQICWVLRPFIWDESRPVEFVGPEYLRGSFYETVFNAAARLLKEGQPPIKQP